MNSAATSHARERLVTDLLAIASSWTDHVVIDDLIGPAVNDLDVGSVDVVAIGKAAPEMTAAAAAHLGERLRRRLVISDADAAASSRDVVIGEHPVPGPASLRAAHQLLDFLGSSDAELTLVLLSGGASSLCALPVSPVDLGALGELWTAALAVGADITTLNRLRAATSQIAGGAVLRRVKTPRVRTLIEVDNVVSGAPWVASGMTFDYDPSPEELDSLIVAVGLPTALADRFARAGKRRRALMAETARTDVENVVVADPEILLREATGEAIRRGYSVISLGQRVIGDVEDVVADWSVALDEATQRSGPQCLLGVGEVTVRVTGDGLGGRCQAFAWSMAGELARLARPAAFAARASDGRDFVAGVAGGWADDETVARASSRGVNWLAVKERHDSFHGLRAVDQLLPGARTGWNLCDLYVAVL